MIDDGDLTPLLEAATASHELFVGFMEGGFTEDQALRLVILFIIEGAK